MADVEFAILGAGAIGSILGAHLARAGRRVTMLARAPRAQQLERLGLRIKGLAEFCQPVAVLTEPSQLRSAEVLIVATKTGATEAALAPLRGASIDAALSIQNGLMKNEQLAAVFGRDRVLGALANTSGELLPSGEVLFTRNANLYVGELHGGYSARARGIADTIDSSGVRSTAAANIQSLEWSKFAAWAPMMVLSITTRAPTWKYAVDAGSAWVMVRLLREVGRLAEARGIELSDDSVLPVAAICHGSEQQGLVLIRRFGEDLRASAPGHRMSSLQDLEAGRSLEVEETLGHAVRLARDSNVSTPLLSAFYALAAGMDRMRGDGGLGAVRGGWLQPRPVDLSAAPGACADRAECED